jgi:hypothetical protein
MRYPLLATFYAGSFCPLQYAEADECVIRRYTALPCLSQPVVELAALLADHCMHSQGSLFNLVYLSVLLRQQTQLEDSQLINTLINSRYA